MIFATVRAGEKEPGFMTMLRARDLGLACGRLPPGPGNRITDVPGVRVGHHSIVAGELRTGVTAILPHAGNVFRDKPLAAAEVLNGFGKSVGLMQVEELGQLETPILLTNTLSVGTCANALIRRAIAANPDIGRRTSTVNPVVGECNDGHLSDIQAMAVTEAHAFAALDAAGARLAEFGGRFRLVRGSFADLGEWVAPESCDGVLLDLGVSSAQLDQPGRGFSFLHDGPLDMRMDRRQEVTAAKLVNEEMNKIAQSGVTARELERAKNQLRAQYLDQIASVGGFSGKADLLNYYNYYVGNPDYIQQDVARFEAVTAADVQRVAREQFAKPKVVLTVVPEGESALMVKKGGE